VSFLMALKFDINQSEKGHWSSGILFIGDLLCKIHFYMVFEHKCFLLDAVLQEYI